MSYPSWQGGHLYNPADIVIPVSAGAAVLAAIANADFESGDTAWTKSNVTIVNTPAESFAGSYYCRRIYTGGSSASVVAVTHAACVPGQSITLTCMVKPTGAALGAGGYAALYWYDAGDAFLSSTVGTTIATENTQTWQQSTVTGIAPTGAAFVRAAGNSYNITAGCVVRFDNFVWNYTAPVGGLALVFKATQAVAATSASSEPIWPITVGGTVVDGGVTWAGIQNSRVTWTAHPSVKTGGTEPTWPTTPGAVVSDGTVLWQCVSLRVTDVNCPNTKEVVIAAGKVYAADKDIIRYCATVNPLDWTTANDAGYLPYGLQTYGSNPVAALGLYRSNLAAFNSEGFQMWQVNEDPQQSALLDALPIGSTQHRALAPVSNDLFFLSSQGVRTVALSASSDSLQAGDVGMPIDSMVRYAMIAAVASGSTPIATYYPPQGQYFLAFPTFPASALTLTGDVPNGLIGTVFNYAYSVSGGVGPYTLSIISGSLPPGLAMSASGVVTGTATTLGSYSWTVQAVDSIGTIVTLADSAAITLPAIAIVGSPPAGEISVAYSYTWGATGGTGTGYVWAVASGTIPAGLTFNTATGVLSGTPTTNATYNFTLRVTDSGANTTTAAETVTIVALSLPHAILQDAPILYWKLNETSGTVVTDYSGYGRNGTLAGTYTQATSGLTLNALDTSVIFPGTNLLPSPLDVGTRRTWTMECYATRAASAAGSIGDIEWLCGQWRSPNFGLFPNALVINVSKKPNALFTNSSGPYGVAAPSVIVDTVRTQIVAVREPFDGVNDAFKIYINGTLVSTTYVTITTLADPSNGAGFTVGGGQAAGGYFPTTSGYLGAIDDVAVYATSMSAARVLIHSQAAGL